MILRYLIPALMISLLSLASCSYMRGPFPATFSDARLEIALAEQADASTYASREIDEARILLSQAERAAGEGDEKGAERLAERALLMARYAKILASYRKLKREVEREEIELQTLQREVEAAKVKRQSAEAELKRLTKGGDGE